MDFTQNRLREEKKHKFIYRDILSNDLKDKFNSADNKTIVKNELNFVAELGITKKDYDTFLSN